jgi:hypothetical protein
MGNPQLSFPAVAMRQRSLGSAYVNPSGLVSNDFEIGPDQYGWSRDGNRMAMAKVQSTKTAQNVYDRQPRSVRFGHIIPDGHTSHPYGSTQDMGDNALRFWLNSAYDPATGVVRGGGSIGALSTPEGQRYRRKILDARRDQLMALDNQQDTAPLPPTTEKDLNEVEANKVQIDLEFNQIIDEVDSGIVERGTAGDFNKWARKFATTLPYYNNTDVERLNAYMEGIYETLYRNAQVVADRIRIRGTYGRENEVEKDEALTRLLRRTTDTLIKLIKEYMKGINLQLPERILLVKNILRRLGMEGLSRAVVVATPQAVANDEEDVGDNRGDDQDGGGADGYAPFLPPRDDGIPVEIGEEQVPRQGWEDLPQTQLQISQRARQIVIDTGVNLNEATARVARAWTPFTNYTPRPNTDYKAVKRTLVERIKAYKRSLGGEGIDNLFRGLALQPPVEGEFPVALGEGRPRLVGRQATGGRSVHHRLAATQEAKAIRRINEASRR